MMISGLSLGTNDVSEVKQLTPALQRIVAKHKAIFDSSRGAMLNKYRSYGLYCSDPREKITLETSVFVLSQLVLLGKYSYCSIIINRKTSKKPVTKIMLPTLFQRAGCTQSHTISEGNRVNASTTLSRVTVDRNKLLKTGICVWGGGG